ncbi:MAG: hypothetical protein NTW19_19050 [Planctomycetota bacterium]|nr:hypothetical protein [Planctomycetota bacterium]
MGDKPSTNWVRSLRLRRFDSGVAVIAAPPGRRDLQKFLNGIGRDQLARQLTSIIGRPVKVEIEPPADAQPEPSPAGGANAGPSVMQQAMTLPLVKQVMDVFDVTMMDARPDTPPTIADAPDAAPPAEPTLLDAVGGIAPIPDVTEPDEPPMMDEEAD